MRAHDDDDGDDSVRARAAAGLQYFVTGALVCAVAVLMIHEGTTGIPYWGGGSPVPVEMIAGLGGIIAFMGIVQLLVAWILKRRGHP